MGQNRQGSCWTRLTLEISQMAPLLFLFFFSSVFLWLFLRFFVATRCIFHIINWSRHAAILYNSAASLVHSWLAEERNDIAGVRRRQTCTASAYLAVNAAWPGQSLDSTGWVGGIGIINRIKHEGITAIRGTVFSLSIILLNIITVVIMIMTENYSFLC